MFEDLLENNLLSVKIEIIRDGEVIERLVDMASQPNYRFPQSERIVRAGYMGFVVKLANFIVKVSEKENLTFTDEWAEFVAGELDSSNKTN